MESYLLYYLEVAKAPRHGSLLNQVLMETHQSLASLLQSGYYAAFFHLIFDGAAAGVSIALVLLQECLGGTMRFPLDIQLCFQSFQVSIRFF